MIRLFLMAMIFFACANLAHAEMRFVDNVIRYKIAQKENAVTKTKSTTKTGWFVQKLDHKNENSVASFKQKYFINSDYAVDKTSPVIYVICGEAPCAAWYLEGAVATYARELKAHRVALEHRYYGVSQPFSNLATENLSALTTENALLDLERFQTFARFELGLGGKWLIVGGSYAGSLAAYYKLKFPHHVSGALASSAPVKAKDDFFEYDKAVSEAAGLECAQRMRQVVSAIEALIVDEDGFKKIKQVFGAEDIRSPVDFLYVVADMGAAAVQYGRRDELCGALQSQEDLIQAYGTIGLKILSDFGMTPLGISFQSAESLNINSNASFGMRQWLYQTCTEYGYWQIAHHDPTLRVRSSQINLNYHNETCRRIFGLQDPVNPSVLNGTYYFPLLTAEAQRILYLNGSVDPWMALSVTEENGNHANPHVESIVIEGAAHCDDLSGPQKTDSESLTAARSRARTLFKEWLK